MTRINPGWYVYKGPPDEACKTRSQDPILPSKDQRLVVKAHADEEEELAKHRSQLSGLCPTSTTPGAQEYWLPSSSRGLQKLRRYRKQISVFHPPGRNRLVNRQAAPIAHHRPWRARALTLTLIKSCLPRRSSRDPADREHTSPARLDRCLLVVR